MILSEFPWKSFEKILLCFSPLKSSVFSTGLPTGFLRFSTETLEKSRADFRDQISKQGFKFSVLFLFVLDFVDGIMDCGMILAKQNADIVQGIIRHDADEINADVSRLGNLFFLPFYLYVSIICATFAHAKPKGTLAQW